jgi:hypothetical protein
VLEQWQMDSRNGIDEISVWSTAVEHAEQGAPSNIYEDWLAWNAKESAFDKDGLPIIDA